MSWDPNWTDPTRCIDQYRLSSFAIASLPWRILESLGTPSRSERHRPAGEVLAVQSSLSDIGSWRHDASILFLLSISNPYARTIAIHTWVEWNILDKRPRFQAHHCIAHENGHFETIECSSVMYSLDLVSSLSLFSPIEPQYLLHHLYILSSSQSHAP